ncbi:transporter, Ompp1/FadL/TodX family [Haemophilus pittmaniae HK 85]|uniref:Transporter, Ompp1/FadL/TodX family n=1 Tax=Haemophilus pittmaniae HK 85 TaxID=1035188 RepID=F9QB14_9PAST|nr:outer membrane protein transport protein [Haemophilus pittmaniae]EGV05253.1 transporter, Ompp1/FadL/TodX family [Haemophilus pittmaniae HK 85]SNV80968.1 outer membrane protein P1 [Haemophilus pittmaniae]
MKTFKKSLLAVATLLAAGGANAAAFQLAEVSSVGLGRAYAGEAAMADNASVVATNPALMSLFKTNQFSAGGVYVDSRIHMNGPITVKANLPTGSHTLASTSAAHNSVVPGSLIPNMYFVAPLNDKFAVGGGMNVNFGLKSEYEHTYSGGVFGGTTDLSAINLNLSGSYRVTEGFSVGLGVNAVYARAEIERRAGVLSNAISNAIAASRAGVLPLSPRIAGALAGFSGVQSDTVVTHLQDKNAWGFGWNAGLMYQFNERNRIGLAYHSKVDIDFKDRAALSLQRTATGGVAFYVNEGGLTLHLPGYVEFSGFHQLTDKLAMHYSYKYTQWGRFKNLHATYDNGSVALHKEEQYSSNSRTALGFSYDVNDKLTLRAGIAYDEAAAPNTHASASIPDTDRTWYSVGATYKFTPNLSIDAGFAHLRGKKLNFTEKQSLAGGLIEVQADYQSKASANLYGLNLNYSF